MECALWRHIKMWNPFQDFPREYGTPGRKGIVYSCKELLEKMKLFNCKTDFYTSLYSFEQLNEAGNRGNYTTSVLNNLYLESDKGSLEPVLKLHEYCSTRNLYHSFFFSGRGFHFYIGTKPGAINKKGAITNAQVDICDSLDLKIGINGDSDIDGHVIGNLAQLVRVPNSFNIKRKYFCIPLRVEDLTTLEDIKQKAKKPRAGIPIYGKELLDLTPFDREPEFKDCELAYEMPTGSIDVSKINVEKFVPCMRELLSKRFIKHRERYLLIIYLRDLGLPLETTIELLRRNLDTKVFKHCVFEEHQAHWCYRRLDLVFPKCETLKGEGLCCDDNCKGAGL